MLYYLSINFIKITREGRMQVKRTEAKLFKRWDIAVFAVILLFAVLLFSFGLFADEGAMLSVTVGDKKESYSLETDRVFKLENNGVTLTVSIKDGEVTVKSSDCPDRVCVASGKISKVGQTVVCAPAQISLRIVGSGGGELDAVTG